jgi:hypothetical protein
MFLTFIQINIKLQERKGAQSFKRFQITLFTMMNLFHSRVITYTAILNTKVEINEDLKNSKSSTVNQNVVV